MIYTPPSPSVLYPRYAPALFIVKKSPKFSQQCVCTTPSTNTMISTDQSQVSRFKESPSLQLVTFAIKYLPWRVNSQVGFGYALEPP